MADLNQNIQIGDIFEHREGRVKVLELLLEDVVVENLNGNKLCLWRNSFMDQDRIKVAGNWKKK